MEGLNKDDVKALSEKLKLDHNHFKTYKGKKFIMDYLTGSESDSESDGESDQFLKVIKTLLDSERGHGWWLQEARGCKLTFNTPSQL